MTYHIDRNVFDTRYLKTIGPLMTLVEQTLEKMTASMESLIGSSDFEGDGAEAMKEYLFGTHLTVIKLLKLIAAEFQMRVPLFSQGLDTFEEFIDAIYDENFFIEIERSLDELSKHIQDNQGEANECMVKIADLIESRNLLSIERYIGCLEVNKRKVAELREGIKEYDESFGQTNLENVAINIDNARTMLWQMAVPGEVSVDGTVPGRSSSGYSTTESMRSLYEHMAEAEKYISDKDIAAQNEAYCREVTKHNAELQKVKDFQDGVDKFLEAMIDTTVFAAEAGLFIATGGTSGATGLLGFLENATLVTGAGKLTFQGSEIIEEYSKAGKIMSGDRKSKGFNPVREFYFLGNEDAYSFSKEAFSISYSVFSASKGLVKSVSGYGYDARGLVRGTVSYGTKEVVKTVTKDVLHESAQRLWGPYSGTAAKIVSKSTGQLTGLAVDGATGVAGKIFESGN